MSDTTKVVVYWFLGVAVLFITGVLLTFGNLSFKKFFGVWDENINREIYEETKSYVHGTIQNLQTLKLEYETAETDGHRKALREAILMEYSTFKHKDQIPANLSIFINSL